MELKDSFAVITGAGKGIGKAIAEKFSEEGASVALWDVDLDSAENVAEALDASGKQAIAMKADTTNEAEIDNALAEVLRRFNRVRSWTFSSTKIHMIY